MRKFAESFYKRLKGNENEIQIFTENYAAVLG